MNDFDLEQEELRQAEEEILFQDIEKISILIDVYSQLCFKYQAVYLKYKQKVRDLVDSLTLELG